MMLRCCGCLGKPGGEDGTNCDTVGGVEVVDLGYVLGVGVGGGDLHGDDAGGCW